MRPEKSVDEILERYITSAKQEDVDSHCNHVFQQLQARANEVRKHSSTVRPIRRSFWPIAAAIAAVIAIAVVLPTRVAESAPAVLQDANGSHKIQYGEIVRSSDDMNAVLAMAGGARVEMRSMSELFLERAEGGVRIRLNNGGVIVDAARQQNLYVQTKDVMASVGGAVSLVKAEEHGSRVAAIGGEVRVQQGATEKKLRPGEQAASNPKMESVSVKEEVAWSREAEAHVAMLQQSALATGTRGSTEPRLAFEVASIRPSSSANRVPGARGGGVNPAGNGCGGFGGSQVDPRRFAIANTSLYHLIVLAYPGWAQPHGRCHGVIEASLLSGGEGWLKSDLWDIEALIPEGTPSYTSREFDQGKAPELEKMLQVLLAERFKLTIRRETKEIPVYFLTVAKGGPKFNGPPLGRDGKPKVFVHDEPDGTLTRSEAPGKGSFLGVTNPNNGNPYLAWTGNISMREWVASLISFAKRPVLDRTGLNGEFIFHFESDEKGIARLPLMKAIEEIGLKVEEGKAPTEVWVIERAEKPSEN